jgi:hypothetical protein
MTTQQTETWTKPVPIDIDPKWNDNDLRNIQFFMEKSIDWANTTKRFSREKKTIMVDTARFFYTFLYKYNYEGNHWGSDEQLDSSLFRGYCFKLRKINDYAPHSQAQFKLAKGLFKLWDSPEHFNLQTLSTECNWKSHYEAMMNRNRHPMLWAREAMAELSQYYMANWCSAFWSSSWSKKKVEPVDSVMAYDLEGHSEWTSDEEPEESASEAFKRIATEMSSGVVDKITFNF